MSSNAVRAFNAALEAVLPTAMVHNHLSRKGDVLSAGGKQFKLANNVYVVGFGKAVSGMCRAIQNIAGDHIVRGLLSVPTGTTATLTKLGNRSLLPVADDRVSLREGASNNLPDEKSVAATNDILDMMRSVTGDDLIITLISGGGSALLCAPKEPVTLEEKLWVTNALARQGASISELNIVRKKLSKVKGGRLANEAFPAKVVSLILSDIVGDPVDLIASGPTVQDQTSEGDCDKIFKKYSIRDKLPSSVSEAIFAKQENLPQARFHNVHNIIVGSNSIAVDAAVAWLKKSGYQTFVLSKAITGEARKVGDFLMELSIEVAKMSGRSSTTATDSERWETLVNNEKKWTWIDDIPSSLHTDKLTRKIGLVGAGETTVSVKGNGKGGRNQEMTLAAAMTRFKNANSVPSGFKFTFLSAGTDGQDGPTDAAGAVFDTDECPIVRDADALRQAEDALAENDSYSFLRNFDRNILRTGLTGTNVMDMQIITIEDVID